MSDRKPCLRVGSYVVLVIAIAAGWLLPTVGLANGSSHNEETWGTITWLQTQAAVNRTLAGDCDAFIDKECYEECVVTPTGQVYQQGIFACRSSSTVP